MSRREVIGTIDIGYPEGIQHTVITPIAPLGEWLLEAARIYDEEAGQYDVRVMRRWGRQSRCIVRFPPQRF